MADANEHWRSSFYKQERYMNPSLFSVFAIFPLTAMLGAQVAPQPATAPNSTMQAPATASLASGTILSVELSKSLDAKKLKANDKFEARTVIDLLSHGQIVIPRNTKVIGHVTEAKARSKESPDSILGLTFDRMVTKDGREIPLQAAVQAIARPLQTSPAFPTEDPMAPSANGLPSQSQRGAMTGSTNSGTPMPNPAGYPPGGPGGLPPDAGGASSTVSPLGPTSKGVVGIKSLSLESSGPASVVTSKTANVHLDGGTQLILRVQ
jgi:hypothetical protein